MKYLDEQITVKVSGFDIRESSTYPYTITDLSGSVVFAGNLFLQERDTSVDIDITFLTRSQKYVPSILSNIDYSTNIIDIPNTTVLPIYRQYLLNKYTVTITIGSTDYSNTSETVALIYRYPNRKDYLNTTIQVTAPALRRYNVLLQGNLDFLPHYPAQATTNYPFLLTFQKDGQKTDISTKAVGKINTLKATYNLNAGVPVELLIKPLSEYIENSSVNPLFDYTTTLSTNMSEYSGGYYVSNEYITHSGMGMLYYDSTDNTWRHLLQTSLPEVDTTRQLNISTNLTTSTKLSDINTYGIRIGLGRDGLNYDEYVTVFPSISEDFLGSTIYIKIDITSRQGEYIIDKPFVYYIDSDIKDTYIYLEDKKVAVLDTDCYADYYLMWQDRFGSFQSQPFSGTVTFSEKFEKGEILNTGGSRFYNISVQPNWKLNTGWLNDEVYPYYESIFINPHVLLYDTKEDVTYVVQVTDSEYTEKTFKNQKRMFNLTLDVKENKKQNIIY